MLWKQKSISSSGHNMNGKSLFVGLLIFLVSQTVSADLKVGGHSPDFKIASLSGSIWTPKRFSRASLSVVYFFRPTRCKVCAGGLKSLEQTASDIGKQNFVAIGIGRGTADELKAYSKKHGLKLPVLPANKAGLKKMGVFVYPTMLVLGPDQKVINLIQGGQKKTDVTEKMMFALAERYIQRKDFKAAKNLYSQMEKTSKNKGLAKAGQGYSLLKEGKLADAETTFKKMSQSSDDKVAIKGKEGLAEVYLQQGKADEAIALADSVIKSGGVKTAALLTKGKALFKKGSKKQARIAIQQASKGKESDFSWQKAEAHYANGNLEKANKNARVALVSYEKAVETDPYFVEALSNQGVALQDLGEPEKALNIFKKVKKIDPKDRLVYSLMRQAQSAIAQKQDIERQKYIDGLVSDLLTTYNKNKGKPNPNQDDWTSPVLTVSILGFKSEANNLMGRAGLEGVLQDELTRELQSHNIKVVERAVIDKLLAELKLGASDLTDPDASLKLGRIMAARLIATGSTYNIGKKSRVTLRLVDSETTNIVASYAKGKSNSINPVSVAKTFAKEIAATTKDKYPLKGRIANVDDESIIINLGKKHGVKKGQVFNVLGEGKPITIRGKILGYKKAKLGQLVVIEVDDLMAFATVKEKKGEWKADLKIKVKN